uniref:E3 SUMO-protein ligase ZBED1-like n=1 Tax=Pristiophorus japonicus TaxID=55135 RepID=UPI00398F62E0
MWSHRSNGTAWVAEMWKYVTKRDDKTIVCSICGQELALSGSATSLRLHLERSHHIHFREDSERSKLQGAESVTERIPGCPSAKDRTPKITELIGIDSPVTITTHSSKRISEMLRECAARLEEDEDPEIHSFAGGRESHAALAEDELSMVLRYHGGNGGSRRRKGTEPNYRRSSPVSGRDKSRAWNFFKKLNERCVECSLCRTQLCYHSSATSLREHLRRKHNLSELDLCQCLEEGSSSSESAGQDPNANKNKAPSISDLALHEPKPCAENREEVISDLILGLVFRDLQPLSLVGHEGFKRLLGFLEPAYPMPSSAHLATGLRHKYGLAKLQLERGLRSAVSLTLSTDTWTSPDKQGYLTVVAHFIDCGWRPARCVLRTSPQPTPAPELTGELLRSALSHFGLPSTAVSCVVHDSAGGLLGCARSLQDRFGWCSLCCASRTLQLCVKLGLQVEPVPQALAAARRLVSYFQHSARAAAQLSGQLAARDRQRPGLLVMDTASRWSSTFDMCEQLLEARRALGAVLEDDPAANPTIQNLSDQQWKLLQDLLPILRTLKVASSFLGEEQNASVSSLMPCLHGVMTALMHHHGDPGCIVKMVSTKIRAEIGKRWHLPEEQELLENPAIVASFLDPRFKDLRFLNPEARDEVHNKVKNMLSGSACRPRSPSPSSSSSSDGERGSKRQGGRDPGQCQYDLLFGEDPSESLPEIHQQLEGYLSEPLRRRHTDPFNWWRGNEHRFPAVAALARRYLAIPATSVSATAPFFSPGALPNHTRPPLPPDLVDQVVFLHKNFDYVESLKRFRQ